MKNVILPIVHLNGTSASSLIDARIKAYEALHEALDAFSEVAPNGRDYYPEPGRMKKAIEQHNRRCEAIFEITKELEYEIGEIEKYST